jgi:hypothetical protein
MKTQGEIEASILLSAHLALNISEFQQGNRKGRSLNLGEPHKAGGRIGPLIRADFLK